MSEQHKRILFLCARSSGRELIAASLLATYEPNAWNIWIAPAPFPSDEVALARQVLSERGVPLLATPQTAEPSFFDHS